MKKPTKEQELKEVRSAINCLNKKFADGFLQYKEPFQKSIIERLNYLKERQRELTKELYG